jgi:hypothetical protein
MLTALTALFAQDFKQEIKDGLYLWSSGTVIQLTSDSLIITHLRASRSHLYKVADIVYDSAAKTKMLRESDPMWDKLRPNEIYVIRASKILDIVEFSNNRFSILVPGANGFNSINFVKRDFGYEVHTSNHLVKRNRIRESVKLDTVTYFKLCAFTLADLKKLKELRTFDSINQTELEVLATVYLNSGKNNIKLIETSKFFGHSLKQIDNLGIIAGRELIIKSLIELRLNPLITSYDPDLIYEKLKPILRLKR